MSRIKLIGILYGTLILLALALALSCANNLQRRHTAVQTSDILSTALGAVQDTEIALHQAGRIADPVHVTFQRHMAGVLEAGKAFNEAVKAWPPGSPAPPELRVLIERVFSLAQEVFDLLPEGDVKSQLVSKLAYVQQVLLSLSLVFAGG